jgi:hypothetical protein
MTFIKFIIILIISIIYKYFNFIILYYFFYNQISEEEWKVCHSNQNILY